MAALATAAVIGRASGLTTAGSLAVAGHGTERAGGRPQQDARLVHLSTHASWMAGSQHARRRESVVRAAQRLALPSR